MKRTCEELLRLSRSASPENESCLKKRIEPNTRPEWSQSGRKKFAPGHWKRNSAKYPRSRLARLRSKRPDAGLPDTRHLSELTTAMVCANAIVLTLRRSSLELPQRKTDQ